MNTLLFLCGAGCGALLSMLIILLLIRLWSGNSKMSKQAHDESLSELKRRNDIGERQVAAIESLVRLATKDTDPNQ